MVCTTSCSIAAIFLIGMIYQSFSVDKSDMYSRFMATLSVSEKEKYERIVSERRKIYLSGYVIGLILSFLYIQMFYSKEKGGYSLLCIVAAITFLTSYFYYILHPKRQLMIVKLSKENQRREWVNIYKKMQYHYHMGIVLGMIAVIFLAKGLCH